MKRAGYSPNDIIDHNNVLDFVSLDNYKQTNKSFNLTEAFINIKLQISCEKCPATYICETERSLKQCFLEHRRPSSVTSQVYHHVHSDHPDHSISMDDTNILEVEPKWCELGVKEAIHIWVTHPFLNKDGRRYNLPSVWTNILNERTRGPGRRTSSSNQSHQDDTKCYVVPSYSDQGFSEVESSEFVL